MVLFRAGTLIGTLMQGGLSWLPKCNGELDGDFFQPTVIYKIYVALILKSLETSAVEHKSFCKQMSTNAFYLFTTTAQVCHFHESSCQRKFPCPSLRLYVPKFHCHLCHCACMPHQSSLVVFACWFRQCHRQAWGLSLPKACI